MGPLRAREGEDDLDGCGVLEVAGCAAGLDLDAECGLLLAEGELAGSGDMAAADALEGIVVD